MYHRLRAVVYLLLTASIPLAAQSSPSSDSIDVLIRCDDAGMSHAVNMAFRELAASGMPFSASVMVGCPWFPEAVEILNQYRQVSVGVHLTLNAEWKEYRWGPVLGAAAVPSLVDSLGYFFPTRAALMAHQPKLDEVERELRAQIQRALTAGLKPDYVDYHMGAAVGTPELRSIVEKLAAEFHLGISRYYGEQYASRVYFAPISGKTDTLVALLDGLTSGGRHLLVFHIGKETPELDALTDQNVSGLPGMSRHRNAERGALLSGEVRKALQRKNIRLLTYGDLWRTVGAAGMKRPE